MMYAAIAGKVPTVGPFPVPHMRVGSLRWFATHCRRGSHKVSHSLRRVARKCGKADLLSMSPGDVASWFAREARHVGGIAHRSLQASVKVFHRAH